MNSDKVLRLPNINFVIISGRLVSDAEKRVTSDGRGFIKLRIANDQTYRRDSQWVSEPLFIDVIYSIRNELRDDEVFRRLLKGTPIVVEGKLRYREWETEGKRYFSYYINAYRLQVLERKVGQIEEHKEEFSELDEEEGLPPEDIPF